MFALPSPPAFVGAPRTPTFTGDQFIAPVTPPNFASPFRQHARNSFGNKWWKFQLVNRVFQLFAFCGHDR
jgi:hypothetical protein